jgi:hypothetical protein
MFKHPLAREISLAIVVKLTIVIGAAFFVFGPKQRPTIDPSSVQTRLIGAIQPKPEPGSAYP